MHKYDWNKAFPDTPKGFHNKIESALYSLENKENDKMKEKIRSMKLRKGAIVAIAATFIIGTTVFATGKITSFLSISSSTPEYTSMPTEKQIEKDAGMSPKLLEAFENGYSFDSAKAINKQALDEEDNIMKEFKSVGITYKNTEGILNLFMESDADYNGDENSKIVCTYEGIDLNYFSYINKIVPSDYEMTKQDKEDETSGKYIFSFGSQEVEISEIQSIRWIDGGISYSLLGIDSELGEEDLIGMAKEIIDVE
ncbi:MAG: hypothetical protein VB120_02800 [Lachnospiraceae bacterium]|nr:hypothetical protein [Lachnospiraceae bacterium]